MNGRMPLLERGDLVPAGAWYPITVETFDLAHKESRRMRMESWIEALTSDHSREAALSVLAKNPVIAKMEGNILHQYVNRMEFEINVPPRWLISLVTGGELVLWTLKQSLDSTDKTGILGWIFLSGIHQELGPLLAGSPAAMLIIFQEIFTAYSQLRHPVLLDRICKRASDALILLKCVASHPNTRMLLLDAKVTQCLTAFVETNDCRRPYELLRFSCLCAISALVQDEDEEIVECLLKSRLLPRILSCLERGPEFTKTVAAFIVFRIVMHDSGLKYCCSLPDRFSAISRSLAIVVSGFGTEPHPLLVSCVVGCYFRLSKHPRACDGLPIWLPERLQSFAWTARYHDDREIIEWARQLRINVASGHCNHPIFP